VTELVRQGNLAFAREDYDSAVRLYEQAEVLTTDPGLVAFNKAAALYRLGEYRQAEQHFRRCLEDASGLRRARSLYNLGNSLVKRARTYDVEVLREAVGCYEACLSEGQADSDLVVDARDNLKFAREALAQAEVARKNNPDQKENPDKDPNDPRHQRNPSSRSDGNDAEPARGAGQDQMGDQRGIPGQRPIPAGQQPRPGAGNVPVLREGDSPPLSPQDTEALLKHVEDRIRREHRQRQRSPVPPSPRNLKDW
jgi:tetratricopeptide (TPR) repeat protein